MCVCVCVCVCVYVCVIYSLLYHQIEVTTKAPESSAGTTVEVTPPPAVGTTGMVPLAVPNIQVQEYTCMNMFMT